MGTSALDIALGESGAPQQPDALDLALGTAPPSPLRAKAPALAPSDALQQKPRVNPQAFNAMDGSVLDQVLGMGAQAVQHPLNTAASVATAPYQALKTAGGFLGQTAAEMSLPDRERAYALADPERIDEPSAALAGVQLALPMLPLTGLVGRGLQGAATGAAYMPEQPIAGALVGGAAGALHANLANDPYAAGANVQRPSTAITDNARTLANPETTQRVESPSATAIAQHGLEQDVRLQRAKALFDETTNEQPQATPTAPVPDALDEALGTAPSPAPEENVSAMRALPASETPELDAILAERDAEQPAEPTMAQQARDHEDAPAAAFAPEENPRANAEDGTAPAGSTAPDEPVPIPHGPHPAPAAPGIPSKGGRLPSFSEVKTYLQQVFNPGSLDEGAGNTKDTIRATTSQGQQQQAIAKQALQSASKYAGGLSRTQNTNIINLMERTPRGQAVRTGDPQMDQMIAAFRTQIDGMEKKLVAIGKLTPTQISYVGRYVVQPEEKANQIVNAVLSKRPAYGPQSFGMQRTYPHFTDMLDAGLTPLSYNWVDVNLMKMQEMQRVLDMHAALEQERAAGRMKNLMVGKDMPEGWNYIDQTGRDPAFTVYGPRSVEIEEAHDTHETAALDRAIGAVPGLTHYRAPKLPLVNGQRALGFAVGPDGKYMASQFASPNGVKSHELGHILDFRYGLGNHLHNTDDIRGTRTLRKELAALAAQRHRGTPLEALTAKDRAYFYSQNEQTANATHAYLHAPELMKELAPNVQKRMKVWIDDMERNGHRFATHLKAVKPSLMFSSKTAELPIPGIRIMGRAIAPQNSAQVWNNYLSKGIGGNPFYRLWRAPSNAATQAMLGISGFHMMTTSFDAAFSEAARHLQKVLNPGYTGGERAKAAATLIPKSIAAPFTHLALGHKVLAQYRIPGLHPELQHIINAAIQGGFKVAPAQNERLQMMLHGIRNALESNATVAEKIKGMGAAAWNAPWAAIEQTARPILGGWVPRLKAAAIMLKVQDAMEEAAKDGRTLTGEYGRQVVGKIVDDADWRLGQVMRDNHFVNRVADNIASALFLAPGWTTGTLVLAGKAAHETGQAGWDAARGKRPKLGANAAYAIAMVVGTAIWGALTTKSMTGENPQSAKDLFFPRDGTFDADGNANRINPPTYLTHDIYGYATHFWRTLLGKLNPLISTAGDIAQNKDYFGNEVYNPNDVLLKKTVQVGKRVAQTYVPLSVRNAMEGQRRNDKGVVAGAASSFGFVPASKEVIRSPAQNLMNDLLVAHGHAQLTPEAAADAKEKADAINELRHGVTGAFQNMVAQGKLSQKQIASAMKSISTQSLVARFQQLSLQEARLVYDMASPVEKSMWAVPMQQKIAAEAKSGRTINLQPH